MFSNRKNSIFQIVFSSDILSKLNLNDGQINEKKSSRISVDKLFELRLQVIHQLRNIRQLDIFWFAKIYL